MRQAMRMRASQRRVSQLKLLALLALFAAPALAAWLVHAWWQPSRFSNYGELLPPHPLALANLRDASGAVLPWSGLRGKWVLLVAAPDGCDAACARATCAQAAWLARQARLAQGREQARIERVLLGARPEESWPHDEGAWRATMSTPPAALAQGGLFLVDPLGNLMMRFPEPVDGEGVIRDLRRLLQASRVG